MKRLLGFLGSLVGSAMLVIALCPSCRQRLGAYLKDMMSERMPEFMEKKLEEMDTEQRTDMLSRCREMLGHMEERFGARDSAQKE